MRLTVRNWTFIFLCTALISSTIFFAIPANAAKLPQTITFNPPTTLTATASPQTLSATASSGLAISFTSTPTSVCTVSRTTLTINSAGTCSVTAKQSGDRTYAAANSLTKSITIAKVDQDPLVISNSDRDQTFGSSTSLTTSGGSGSGAVTFVSSAECSVSSKNLSFKIATGGTCSVTATKASDKKYNSISSQPVTFRFFPVLGPSKINSQKIPTSFQNLNGNLAGISYAAWAKSAAQIKVSTSKMLDSNILFYRGTHTTKSEAVPIEAVKRTSKLFAFSSQPSKLHVIYYVRDDISWAQQKFEELMNLGAGYSPNAASDNCKVSSPCWGASSWMSSTKEGVVLIAVGELDLNHTSGTLEAHEFTHSIQTYLDSTKTHWDLPRWLLEGGAEWSQGAAIYHSDYSLYKEERRRNTGDLFNHPTTYSKAWIQNYLKATGDQSWAYWDQFEAWRVYDVGLMATEILVALKGPTSVMNLYSKVCTGSGMTWAQAFKAEYGSEWSDVVPYMADAIAKEIGSANL
jgi:hypothetical protein